MRGKFNLYDFIAVLIPGIFLLWVLEEFANIGGLKEALSLSGNLAETSILIVLGYITGLLLQGISQHFFEGILKWCWGGFPSDRMLLPDDTTFHPEQKQKLIDLIRKKFNVTVKTSQVSKHERRQRLRENQAAFRLCYRAIDKVTETPLTFNAQYGLFRGLFATFVLLAVVTLGVFVKSLFWDHVPDRDTAVIGGVFAFGAFITYLRVKKRSEDFARSVYDFFYAHFSSEL